MTHHITDEQTDRVAAEIALSLGEPWSLLRQPDRTRYRTAARAVLAMQAQPAAESPCACWAGRMCSRSEQCARDVQPAAAGVLDALRDLGEPFGYFRATACGWEDCAEDDEGAIALYTAPAAPSGYALVSEGALRAWGRLDEVRAACVYPITAAPTPSQAPAVPSDEREAFIYWLATTYPKVYSPSDAAQYWDNQHVSALAWQRRAALTAAPTPPAQSGIRAEFVDAHIQRTAQTVGSMVAETADQRRADAVAEFVRRAMQHVVSLIDATPPAQTAVPEDVARDAALDRFVDHMNARLAARAAEKGGE